MKLFSTVPKPSAIQIEQRVNKIYDHLYANAHVRTPKGIAYEVGKILHTAMFIERGRAEQPAFSFSRFELKKFESGDPDFIRVVADDARKNFSRMNKAWQIYASKDSIHLSDFDLAFVCKELSDVLVTDADRDVFGDALEIFRSQWAKRNGGQFFTDQRVTRLAVTLLQFRPDRGDDLVDICAGTGGFLLAGLKHIQQLLGDEPSDLTESEVVEIAYESLRGQEVDREVCEAANATLASRVGNDRPPIVGLGNSLLPDSFGVANGGKIVFGTHKCAATNPPFGTKITIKDPEILKLYKLAYGNHRNGTRLSRKVSPTAPDVLFVEQNIRLLKPGVGRLAIVVPYQIVSGPQTLFVREWLLRNAHILAVIDLPPDTFQPHTGTKASLLVVKRREAELESVDTSEDAPVFMSMPRWIGHDRRGNPVYRRNADGSPTNEVLTDFDAVEEAYRLFVQDGDPTEVHPDCFTIPASDISSDPSLRLNALFHRPRANQNGISFRKDGKPGKQGWEVIKVKDAVERIFYPTRFKRNYVDYFDGAVPFLGGTNISQFIVRTDKWFRPDDPMLADLRVKTGWILVTRSGSTGIVSIVPEAWDDFAVSEHVIRIIPNPTKLPAEYLYTFLRTKYAQEAISRGVFGSVIDEITPEFIGDIDLPVPLSKRTLAGYVDAVRQSEEARNVAINTLLASVSELDKSIS